MIVNGNSLFFIVFAIIVTLHIVAGWKTEKKYFEKFFGLRPSKLKKLRMVLYVLAFITLGISLLDIRGKEEQTKQKTNSRKIAIILDSSLSMLAEDVKPNRFEKAIFLARDFVKSTPNKVISLFVFSDFHRQIVPLTSDKELIDSRLEALKNMQITSGGTSLVDSIDQISKNSIAQNDEIKDFLVFTDGEDFSQIIDKSKRKGLRISVIAIGSLKGTKIPIRDRNGVFRGYKQYNGKDVVTKVDLKAFDVLKDLYEKVDVISVTSYSLPKFRIEQFFSNKLLENKDEAKDLAFYTRKIYFDRFLILSFLLFILSFVLGLGRSWIYVKKVFWPYLLLTTLSNAINDLNAEEMIPTLTPEQLKIIEDKNTYMELMKNQKISLEQKAVLSNGLRLDGQTEDSFVFMKESIKDPEDSNFKYLTFNLGTFYLQNKLLAEGAKLYSILLAEDYDNPLSEEEREAAVSNMKLALVQKAKSDQKKKDEKNQKSDDQKDKNEKSDKGKSNQKDSKGESDQNKQKKDGSSDSDSDQKKKEQANKRPQSEKERNKQSQERRKAKKQKAELPAILKQLVDEDRKVQRQLLKTGTKSKKSKKKKDW